MAKIEVDAAIRGLTKAYRQLEKTAGRNGTVRISEIKDPALRRLAQSAAPVVSTGCGGGTSRSGAVSLKDLYESLRGIRSELLGADSNRDAKIGPSERRHLSSLADRMLDWAVMAKGPGKPGLFRDSERVEAVLDGLLGRLDAMPRRVKLSHVEGDKVLEAAVWKVAGREARGVIDASCGGTGRTSASEIVARGVDRKEVIQVLIDAGAQVEEKLASSASGRVRELLLDEISPRPRPAPRPSSYVPTGC